MLTSKYRLTKEKDFKRINVGSRSFFSFGLRVKYLPNSLGFSRFAFVVSTKTSKKAVIRNRIRRQLRELIRLNLAKIKPGYDIIFSIQPQLVGKSYKEVEASAVAVLNKAKLLK